MKKLVITQSNYIPWKGYFDAINLADELILYDDVQFTRRDWRNRNKIVTPNGLLWLTIPVQNKGRYFQKINETKIDGNAWAEEHWKTIVYNYKKAPYFKEYAPMFESCYRNPDDYLSLVNRNFIETINGILGINTNIFWSNEFNLIEGKTERLVDLCLQRGATDYYSGPAAKAYINPEIFAEAGINLHYFDYSNYPEYKQLFGGFEHGVSIMDLIFNVGPDAKKYMKTFGENFGTFSIPFIKNQ